MKNGLSLVEKMHGSRSVLLPVSFFQIVCHRNARMNAPHHISQLVPVLWLVKIARPIALNSQKFVWIDISHPPSEPRDVKKILLTSLYLVCIVSCGTSLSRTVLWPKREAKMKRHFYNSGLNRGGRVQFKQLLNLEGHSTEYGPLNWLIIAHTLTEIHDTEYYYHEMTDTCFVQYCRI